MTWLFVPLHYLYLIWRAKSLTEQADAAFAKPSHAKLLQKAAKATLKCEKMQIRFPDITTRIDIKRQTNAMRKDMGQ